MSSQTETTDRSPASAPQAHRPSGADPATGAWGRDRASPGGRRVPRRRGRGADRHRAEPARDRVRRGHPRDRRVVGARPTTAARCTEPLVPDRRGPGGGRGRGAGPDVATVRLAGAGRPHGGVCSLADAASRPVQLARPPAGRPGGSAGCTGRSWSRPRSSAASWRSSRSSPHCRRPPARSTSAARSSRWTDPSRPETLTATTSDFREVVAQAWYPTDVTIGRATKYLGAGSDTAVTPGLPPGFFRRYDEHTSTHAFDGVPVSGARHRWPVLLFSPGLGVARQSYTALCTELASRGYVVVAISHPYESPVTMFADGRHAGPAPSSRRTRPASPRSPTWSTSAPRTAASR